MKKAICFNCKKEITFSVDKMGYREECPFCRVDLHSCKGCQFYDEKVYNECRETSADRIKDKDKSNFCDFFQYRPLELDSLGNIKDSNSLISEKDKIKAAAEALFKKF